MNKVVLIYPDKCIDCNACVEICPNKILYLKDDVCNVTDEIRCDKSKGCEIVYPTGAIKIH